MNPDMKKWLAFGTGVGIEIGREDLIATVVRVRPSGIRILGQIRIQRFRDQAAAEWGATYSEFLKKLGAAHLAANILLPRDEVMVRLLMMPGVADKELASAIRFEIDSLNPYSEEDAVFDWSRIGKTAAILVGVTRRSALERYQTLCAEAGIKVTGFTVSAPAIYSALRLLGAPSPDGCLTFSEEGGEIEVYGESAARPIYSARLTGSQDRARAVAVAELRLPPEQASTLLSDALPRPQELPADFDLTGTALSYATALSGAGLFHAISFNLLPKEQRQATSRIRFVPAIALAVLVMLLGGAAIAYPNYADRHYLSLLHQEISKVEPRARKAVELDRQIATLRNRSQTLDNFRLRTKDDLDALNELTNILAPPAWVTGLQLTRDSLIVNGEAEQAAALLKLLDSSRQFRGSSFTTPLVPSTSGEAFSIRSQRQGVTP